MEEKERYELNDNDCIIDNEKDVAICDICDVSESPKILVNLLNEQDKRIKELEETNKVLSNELTKNSILKQGYIETCCGIPIFEIPKIKEENQQLKQSQKQLAIKELERLKENAWQSSTDISQLIDYTELAKIIDNQIKELKGEE